MTISVTVEYFAAFREQAGQSTETVQVAPQTVGELFASLARAHGFRDPQSRCKVAVNDELAAWDRSIADGDRVLFFPPVAGG